MTLRISLRDGEKVVVNGAVLRSVGRTELCIDSKAAILRGREIMKPEEAVTPARQLYFHTMMAYLDHEGAAAHQEQVIETLKLVARTSPNSETQAACASFARKAAGMNYYGALGECRTLMRIEQDVLDRSADIAAEAA